MIKKKEFNGQFKHKIKENITKRDILQPKNSLIKEVPNKLKVNLSSSLKYISNKKKNQRKNKNIKNYFYTQIITKNIQKYNSNSEKNNIMLVNNLIKCKPSHFLALFKDYLITDYIEEFLRRIYFLNESIERIPKLYNYYKNYLIFFCKPTFVDTFSNDIIKNYGDLNAECFYKNNLEKKWSNREYKRILDKKIIAKEFYKNNKNKNSNDEELVKTVFTKSIKNSIDNINEDDGISVYKKLNNENNEFMHEFSNKIQQDNLAAKVWGNDNENLISEENSLLLIINEIKDIKNKNCQRITEKTIKMYKNISNNNNNINKSVEIESTYKTLNTDKNNNKGNKFNILKANTYTKNHNLISIRNMVYSPKTKKNIGFSIKKDKDKINIDKNVKYLSPKNINSKSITNSENKNLNSIVVNINININTNQNNNNVNNNIKSPINNNIKSPIHNINKKRFALSPLSPINLKIMNDKEYHKKDIPFSDIINKEKEKNKEKEENKEKKEKEENPNYIKIIKKKNEYNNILLSSKRNKKIAEINKIKTINSIEENISNNKQNYSCNKDNFIYNKEKENKELNNKSNTNINKNVYFSPKKLGYKPKSNNSMKDLENINEINNKKYIYHKKQNYTINSPLSKKSFIDRKYFSYKRLELNNNDYNNI